MRYFLSHFLPMDGYGYAAIKITEALNRVAPDEWRVLDMIRGGKFVPCGTGKWIVGGPAVAMTVPAYFPDVRAPRKFGLTMFEAMGAGLPVIASRATCHPEVCGDAVMYCDPYDPADIADRIHEVLTDSALSRDLQERGLARVREFSWHRSAKAYLAEIEAAAVPRA